MTIRVLVPHFLLFGIPIFTTLRGAQAAGFDGVEIHLAGRTMAGAIRSRERAKRLGLIVHLHQGWSLAEDSTRLLHNRILHALRLLPHDDYSLENHIPPGTTEPVVVYAERIHEAIGHPNWWLQTACHLDAVGQPRLPLERFYELVEHHRLPVVFDIQHILEYCYGLEGVGKLPRSPERFWQLLEESWHRLQPFVREIHLTDIEPARGDARGRNIYFGKGCLPLSNFCTMVKHSGWDGYVVPEIDPQDLHARGPQKVIEDVRSLFS